MTNTDIMVDLRGTIPPEVLLRQPVAVDAQGGRHRVRGAFGYSGHNRRKCPAIDYGRRLVAAGGLYAIVFEDSATRALKGYQAGIEDATYANHEADLQGYPLEAIIALTADFDASWVDIASYVRGWRDTSRRPLALYANGECIRAAKAKGWIRIGWLTCSGGFRGSRDHTGADVWQRCANQTGQISIAGYGIDTNYLLTADIDAWGQTDDRPAAPPKPFDPPAFPGHYLKVGIRDVAGVTNLKLLLHLAGYKGMSLRAGKISRFNLGTKYAVARFQRRHRLHSDGVVGPITWGELRKAVIAKHNARLAA